MDGAPSVVELRSGFVHVDVPFPFAVLELEAAEEIDNGVLAAVVRGAEHMAGPRLPIFRRVRLAVRASEKSKHRLRQDVGNVERLCDGQVQLGPQLLVHLVFDPSMHREAPFVWRDRDEQRREAELEAVFFL